MAGKGAPLGNQNAAKAKIWTAAIERALHKRSAKNFAAIDDLAEKLLQQCDAGDITALKELGDRLEGKPVQQSVLSTDSNAPLEITWRTKSS